MVSSYSDNIQFKTNSMKLSCRSIPTARVRRCANSVQTVTVIDLMFSIEWSYGNDIQFNTNSMKLSSCSVPTAPVRPCANSIQTVTVMDLPFSI